MPVGKPSSKGSRAEAQERLLVQAAQKDPARFADLYEAHFHAVYAFIARRVKSREIAEDLTSDVFHKALVVLSQFDWRGVPFGVWLFRIAANVVTDQWRRADKESPNDSPETATDVDFEEALHRARLFRLVDDLPADQCRVIRMRFSEGRSIGEIASALRRTEGAVKQLQFRALQNLRKQVSEKKLGARHA